LVFALHGHFQSCKGLEKIKGRIIKKVASTGVFSLPFGSKRDYFSAFQLIRSPFPYKSAVHWIFGDSNSGPQKRSFGAGSLQQARGSAGRGCNT
jgi:hypothetical protein